MWNRHQLKIAARTILARHYWEIFAASLVYSLVVYGASSLGEGASYLTALPALFANGLTDSDAFSSLVLSGSLLGFGTIFALAIGVFLTTPLEVGYARYFLESTQERFNFGNLFFPFTCGRYGNVVLVCFLRNFFTMLWTFLLVFPGIIKAYSYSMVPYLLAENPSLHYNRALALSEDMTRGHKWDMLVLDLSFIGWNLLGALACGVGVIFVAPYYQSTRAQLYIALRAIALDRGLAQLVELEG